MDLDSVALVDELQGTRLAPPAPDGPPDRCRYLTDDTLMARCPGTAVEMPSPLRLCSRHLAEVIVALGRAGAL